MPFGVFFRWFWVVLDIDCAALRFCVLLEFSVMMLLGFVVLVFWVFVVLLDFGVSGDWKLCY